MSDNNNLAKQEPAGLAEYDLSKAKDFEWTGRSMDWFLQMLVRQANDLGVEVGITLTIGAGMISGTLISVESYFAQFADEYANSWPQEGREDIRSTFANLGVMTKTTGDDPKLLPPQYIHLKNVNVHAAGGLTCTGLTLWRGTLASVTGFNLGTLS
ncbi:gas vesicle protein [Pseudomonas tohonis]|uniref:Gas vesicle protein n=1 Tax=Pseudomonas tohonis TaxID=2725477 RepID=A0A6J4E2L7_9PSED|nr:gas vesicle protein [Pseudomonas tohonis]UXY55087.1 hypothetical protein N9L84_11130 [Pseudomonas tohonis]BCG24193.1 hypothetical protein TUM18999_23840 [Pseudomonas tohonis]GJN55728.1 hypothetical protein TUM20286_54800 [Pseudomonas tohonis]